MESLLKDVLLRHLTDNGLIRSTQHGFTKGRSCLTNLLVFLKEASDYIDQGKPVDVIYLDFQKAFDKVPHQRLLKKLEAIGVSDQIVKWIEAWLKDRKQRVVLNGSKSKWSDVLSGVPQGSILGPLLFIIFINDIDDGIVHRLLKFADDTKIYGSVATEEEVEKLQHDLNLLYEWSSEWNMLFNLSKCKVLHLGYNNKQTEYYMNGHKLEAVTSERDLGVIIDHTLKFSEQCVKAVNEANRTLGMIKRTFTNRSKSIIKALYTSIVRPKLEYCVQAWRPYLQKDIDQIENVQRRATKLIQGYSNKSYEERLKLLELTTLETRRTRGDLIEVFKIIKGIDRIESNIFFEKSTISTSTVCLFYFLILENLEINEIMGKLLIQTRR